jgi:pimeloyl-ACP methyl ester carboxylesterase
MLAVMVDATDGPGGLLGPLSGSPSATDGLVPWAPGSDATLDPDPAVVPEGFVVTGGDARIHFLDWREPPDAGPASAAALLVPGLMQPAWSWAPVARRLSRSQRMLAVDLRGQGLSDSPGEGYDLDTLAGDAIAAAQAAGVLGESLQTERHTGPRLIVAGHGLGGIVAAAAAVRLGTRCSRLVLVDGGWERLERTTGLDVDEFLRGLDEPPEVMRSIDAWLADRRAFDPPSWDADQERIARESVVETAAGHVVRTVRPFVVEALVRMMFAYRPAEVLARVEAPVTALLALGSGDVEIRLGELRRSAAARATAGRGPIRVATIAAGHNLMRYAPALVAEAVIAAPG